MHPDNRPPGSTPEDHFANQFDRWLDAFVAGPSTPAITTSEPAAPDLVAVQSAARQVHELAQAATTTRASTPPSVSTQWEALLMSHTSTASVQSSIAPARSPLPIGTKPHLRTRRMETINRIISIAAVLAIFIAGFATAWVAHERFGSEPTMLQLAASPTSTTTCTTKTLSQEDVDRIVASYKEPTLDDYTLSDKPVPETDALAAIATYRATQSCPFGDPAVDSLRWLRSTESESSLAIRNLAQSPSWTAEWLATYQPILEPLSRMLVPPPASAYVVNTGDPAIKPYVVLATGTGAVVLLPSTFVQFADGRIGTPMLRDISIYGPVPNLSRITVEFIIFKHVDGRWLVDEIHPLLCPEDCSAAQGLLDQQIASYKRLATAAATPAPEGADSWLQPVNASECVPVSASTARDDDRPRSYAIAATPAPEGDAVARQSRALTACTPRMPPTEKPFSIVSQFETTRAQQEAASKAPLSPEQIALAQQFSASYAANGYQIVQRAPEGMDVVNSPSAFSVGINDQTFVSALIFRPEESIVLADGRVAIPTTYLVSDDASWDFAQHQPFQWTTLTIWAKVGDTWLIDERLPLCIGDCANFWQGMAADGYPPIAPLDPFTVLYPMLGATPDASPEASPAS